MQTKALEVRTLTDDELADVSGGAINLERIIIAVVTKAFGMVWDKYGDQITEAASENIGGAEVVPGNLI